jgi:hypothetical protein
MGFEDFWIWVSWLFVLLFSVVWFRGSWDVLD